MVNIAFQKLYCTSDFYFPYCLEFDPDYTKNKTPSSKDVTDSLKKLFNGSSASDNSDLLIAYLNILSAYPDLESQIGEDWNSKTYTSTELMLYRPDAINTFQELKPKLVSKYNEIKNEVCILNCLKNAGLHVLFLNCDDIYKKMAYIILAVILCNDIDVF